MNDATGWAEYPYYSAKPKLDHCKLLAEALRNLQIVAFDAAVNSVPTAHVTLRHDLERRCALARTALHIAGYTA